MIVCHSEACGSVLVKPESVFVGAVLQRSLSNTEDECTHLKEMSERGQEELRELANKYNAAVNEIKELTDKIKVPAQTLEQSPARVHFLKPAPAQTCNALYQNSPLYCRYV